MTVPKDPPRRGRPTPGSCVKGSFPPPVSVSSRYESLRGTSLRSVDLQGKEIAIPLRGFYTNPYYPGRYL